MAVQDLLLDPETLNEPFEYFDLLRREAPVFFSSALNAYVITKYAHVRYILDNPKLFSSSTDHANYLMANFDDAYFPIYAAAGTPPPLPTLVVTDGTTHQRYRKLVDSTFNATSVRNLHDQIESIVGSLLDDITRRNHADFYTEFCLKLPIFVICDILGLPREDAPLLKRGADAATRLAGGMLETEEAKRALHSEQAQLQLYLQTWIDRYRAAPSNNLTSQLIHTLPEDGIPLNDRELIAVLLMLNIGGNETTTNGLGNMFLRCFSDPAMQEQLRRSSELIPPFVEESLRLECPVAAMPRFVVQDVEVGGIKIKAGSFLLVSFAAANRDPAQFICPADINTSRPGLRNHVVFGMGVHYCLGAMLARSELRIALKTVLHRLRDVRIVNDGGPLLHERKMTVRALTSLPITFATSQ
jgi:cytochrome P450